jgi:hypothetical protein
MLMRGWSFPFVATSVGSGRVVEIWLGSGGDSEKRIARGGLGYCTVITGGGGVGNGLFTCRSFLCALRKGCETGTN